VLYGKDWSTFYIAVRGVKLYLWILAVKFVNSIVENWVGHEEEQNEKDIV
jgi:hypothetical protein